MPNPPDRKWFAYGMFFKQGDHDFIYRWDDYKWVKSTLTKQDILEQIAREKRDWNK